MLGAVLLSACPGPAGGCVRNSDCASGSYCSGGVCASDCTPLTVAADCAAGESCSSFGMCVAPPDGGQRDGGPPPVDAGVDAFDSRAACVIAGGTDGDGDGFCATAASPDCDDDDAAINPGQAEVCTPNTAGSIPADENCDARTDEACTWDIGRAHAVLPVHVNGSSHYFMPRLSRDGLRLYFGAIPLGQSEYRIFVAARPALDEPFASPTQVAFEGAPAGHFAVISTVDELEAYFQVDPPAASPQIYRATRADMSAPFMGWTNLGYPSALHPSISPDGLELYVESRSGPAPRIAVARREAGGMFGALSELPLAGAATSEREHSPQLSSDGSTLFFGRAIAGQDRIMTSARALDETFADPVELVDLTEGGLHGPYYNSATREIFWSSARAASPAPGSYGIFRAQVCRSGPCSEAEIECATGRRSADGFHCYTAQPTAEVWGNARSACVTLGAHLATIHTADENALVYGLLSSNAWLGAQRTVGGALGEFSWVTGEPWTYASWAAGEPSTFSELAGGYWTDGGPRNWGDWVSSTSFRFVCEAETWPTW
jgi:hypothetical protein